MSQSMQYEEILTFRTEDPTARFGGPTVLNRVNFKPSETKGLALDVIARPTRSEGGGRNSGRGER
jgi:hypothetical protein